MTKTVSLRVLLLVAVVSWLLGGGMAAGLSLSWAGRWVRVLALTHDLEMSGLCANLLNHDSLEDRDRLTLMLENRLESAIQHASLLVDEGARLEIAAPNLKDALRRAAVYYTEKGDSGKAQSAQALLARLEEHR